MSDKYPGGFVTLTTPTGANAFNPALGAAAPGVWTLDQALHYTQNRLWPIYDPYFNQTTLLLHGNGTNGAGNKTFLDSSPNNFPITLPTLVNPNNTTQGTFTPFSQPAGWWSTLIDTDQAVTQGFSGSVSLIGATVSTNWHNYTHKQKRHYKPICVIC